MIMKPIDLLIRCYAEKSDDQWSAVCIDLCLAAQADSLDEARKKLESMIIDYIDDAFGEDREFAADLLQRKAPFSQFVKYYKILLQNKIGALRSDFATIFTEVLPFKHCH